MAGYNGAILEVAGQYLGEREFPGAKHSPVVVGFFEDVGHSWVKDDETAWCAAFVGSILAQVGLPHTGKLNARSYLDWGNDVAPRSVQPGDVCVLWRISPSSWQGHVAFVVRFEGDQVLLRGGNQGNRVSDAWYPVSRVLGYRRMTAVGDVKTSRPLLQHGDRGAFVLDLQEQLRALGYALGRADNIFGDKTRAAVLAFQADNGLTTDGIVGRDTWNALAKGVPRPKRDVTAKDLEARGSRTIKLAKKGEKALTTTEGVLGTGITIGGAVEMANAAQRSEGALEFGQRILTEYWLVLIVVVAVFIAVRYGKYIIRAIIGNRVEDAQNGAHLGR